MLTVGADGKPAWATLGPGLELRGGQIVVTATAVQSVTQAPFLLTVASDGSYVVPPGPAWYTKNGVTLYAGEDYRIEGGRLIPLKPWLPDAQVIQWQLRVNGDPVAFVGLREQMLRAGLQ